MTEEPRLFFGLPLDEAARATVESIVERVRSTEPAGRGVRWVRLDGLHLTLRFLGPTAEDRVDELAAAMRSSAAGNGRIAARISGAGAFPATGRPRTIWLDVTEGVDRLAALAVRLDDALEGAGWSRERRPFRAHLTLARADGVRNGPATVATLTAIARDVAIDVSLDRIVLFESITGSGPARYVARAEASLD